jgi:hypothetical protein
MSTAFGVAADFYSISKPPRITDAVTRQYFFEPLRPFVRSLG